MLEKIYDKLEIDYISKSILLPFLAIISLGAIAFFSASLGILNRNEVKFYGMIESQMYAYLIGIILMCISFIFSYVYIYRLSPYIYILTIVSSFLVFLPGVGIAHGGSTRWINVFGFSLQPAELIKISTVLITAWYLKKYDGKIREIKYALIGYFIIMGPVAIAMFLQKDLGTLIVIGSIVTVIFFTSKSKITHILSFMGIGVLVALLYVSMNSYVRNRIYDYAGIGGNSKGISYQADQALIAIGNGGIFGRGLGKSIQKFHYLPEPAGDSVFAVFSEEFGFFGSVIVVLLFGFLCVNLMLKSIYIKDIFIKNVIIGSAVLLFFQSLLNIGSMLKIIPLSGDTLPFFSQGGTSLIANFIIMGLLLQLTKKYI